MGIAIRKCIAACLALMLLQACSAGSGGGASEREIELGTASSVGSFVYSGPPPASAEVQQFKLSFYDQLAGNDRCGECHTSGGTGTTAFVDQADINNAWRLAQTVANTQEPFNSQVVSRVAAGHNCWLGADQAATCAATVTSYIERWAAGTDTSVNAVRLLPRTAVIPGPTRVMPAALADVAEPELVAEAELLGLLNRYCASCHSDTAQVPQAPFFASSNPETAYNALRGKVDLVTPDNSRLVLRLAEDGHNCWDDCASNAEQMSAAIARFAAPLELTEVDSGLVISMAQVLERDGIIANSGGRNETDLIAKWEFREGSGTTTADTSGVLPEIPLSLSGEYNWLGGWGVRLIDAKAQGGVTSSGKLAERITATGEYSIEAWIAPNNISQENAWIVGYAGGPDNRNLLLTQTLYNYEHFTRSTATEANNAGLPVLSTADDDELAQATLQHVVLTFDPVNGRRIYVNGSFSGDLDESGGGLLNNWNAAYALVLGNTPGSTQPWAGTMRMVAIHNKALAAEQIQENFDVGVGQKYYLLFSVSELLDEEGVCHVVGAQSARTNYCYVVFQVSEFDSSSYLFTEPFFVNINPDAGAVEFDLSAIRLGINGKLADVGQGFINLNSSVLLTADGAQQQALSAGGTIIPMENGADQDTFFLAFDSINGRTSEVELDPIGPYIPTLSGAAAPDIGVRTFDEINASYSVLTGVPSGSQVVSETTGKTVPETFATIRRQLPAIEDFQAFSSSQQMAATQLAAAYCDALVQDQSLREVLFPAPTFDFDLPVADISIDWRGAIVAPLVDRAINTGLMDAQSRNDIIDEVELLIVDDRDLKPYIFVDGNYISDPDPAAHRKRDGLIYCTDDAVCPASRTADVVKAACTAVLGSAVVLLQ